jgi:hypothetical protein
MRKRKKKKNKPSGIAGARTTPAKNLHGIYLFVIISFSYSYLKRNLGIRVYKFGF